MKFVIDMMGGDNGLKATIGATKEFIKRHKDVENLILLIMFILLNQKRF